MLASLCPPTDVRICLQRVQRGPQLVLGVGELVLDVVLLLVVVLLLLVVGMDGNFGLAVVVLLRLAFECTARWADSNSRSVRVAQTPRSDGFGNPWPQILDMTGGYRKEIPVGSRYNGVTHGWPEVRPTSRIPCVRLRCWLESRGSEVPTRSGGECRDLRNRMPNLHRSRTNGTSSRASSHRGRLPGWIHPTEGYPLDAPRPLFESLPEDRRSKPRCRRFELLAPIPGLELISGAQQAEPVNKRSPEGAWVPPPQMAHDTARHDTRAEGALRMSRSRAKAGQNRPSRSTCLSRPTRQHATNIGPKSLEIGAKVVDPEAEFSRSRHKLGGPANVRIWRQLHRIWAMATDLGGPRPKLTPEYDAS